MKNIIIAMSFLLVGLTLPTSLQAQYDEANPDAVILNNGSIIRGEILAFDVDGELKIKIEDGKVLTLDGGLVSSVQFDAKQKAFRKLSKVPHVRKEGFFGTADWAFTPGVQDDYGTIGIDFGLGMYYQFNQWAAIGGGFNFEGLFPKVFIPVYVAYRSYLLPTSSTPYLSMRAGYGIPLEPVEGSEATGGLYLNPTVGFRKKSSTHNFFTAEFGVKYQWAKYDVTDWWWGGTSTQRVRFGRFVMRVGMEF